MQAENIKTLSFGCRLNALEAEKIKKMLAGMVDGAIIVNTCAVTAEAERQSGQYVRRIARENPNVPIFVTGCAATRNCELFTTNSNVIVIANADKMNRDAYIRAISSSPHVAPNAIIGDFIADDHMSKQFIQIQNGCNHDCTYCVTRLLRGAAISFEYADILADVRDAVKNGFYEIVLTGVDSASYAKTYDGQPFLLSDLCKKLLADVPEIRRLRLSSVDPASPEIDKIIDLIHTDTRMMPHLHLSMQSGSDKILTAMRRRHNAARVCDIVARAHDITFGWDIICGFPGETDELFAQTVELARKLRPIKIHAFPFSPRPGTVAATLPMQINRHISKQRVHTISQIADNARTEYMQTRIGTTTSVLVENNNIARTPDDIPVHIDGTTIAPRTICNVKLTNIYKDMFVGVLVKK